MGSQQYFNSNDDRPLTFVGHGFAGITTEDFIDPVNYSGGCVVDFGNYINAAQYGEQHWVEPTVRVPTEVWDSPGFFARLRCQLDDQAWTACHDPESEQWRPPVRIDPRQLTEGDHTLRMTSPDYPGTGTFVFTIDTGAPAAPTIAQFPNDTVELGDDPSAHEPIGVAAEQDAYLFCRWDYEFDTNDGRGLVWLSTREGSAPRWQACSNPVLNGAHAFAYFGSRNKLEVRAVDPAGNVGPIASYMFTAKRLLGPGSIRISSVTQDRSNVAIYYEVGAGGRIAGFECSLTKFDWGLGAADQPADDFRPCTRPATYTNLPGAAIGEVAATYIFKVRAVTDHGLRNPQPAVTTFTVGVDPRAAGLPGTWQAAPGGCWLQTSSDPSDPSSDYGPDPICPATPPPLVETANVTLTTKVQIPRAGRVQHSVAIAAAKRSLCSVRRSYTRKATATLRCRLGRATREALRKRPITVNAVTRFVPAAGSPTTFKKSIKIPRAR